MFKLNYNKQGKLVTELKEVQKRIWKAKRERSECKEFPYCSIGFRKNCSYDESVSMLADAIARLWTNTVSEDEFISLLQNIYKFENASEYFNKLGKYFIALSRDTGEIQRLNKEITELEKKEKELKKELGID